MERLIDVVSRWDFSRNNDQCLDGCNNIHLKKCVNSGDINNFNSNGVMKLRLEVFENKHKEGRLRVFRKEWVMKLVLVSFEIEA